MVLYIPLKASQAQLKVGLYSIFMKLALCEIGFCLMDPCMDALPDTSALAYCPRVRLKTEWKKREEEQNYKILSVRVTFYTKTSRRSLHPKRTPAYFVSFHSKYI